MYVKYKCLVNIIKLVQAVIGIFNNIFRLNQAVISRENQPMSSSMQGPREEEPSPVPRPSPSPHPQNLQVTWCKVAFKYTNDHCGFFP